jgi:hypothetical protein
MDTRGFVSDFMGPTTPRATANPFVMPTFEDGSSYEPGDPVYDAVASHFTPEIWNGLDEDAQWSVIETLEESLPPPESAPISRKPMTEGAGPQLGALAAGAKKAAMPFTAPDIKGLFGSKRRGK